MQFNPLRRIGSCLVKADMAVDQVEKLSPQTLDLLAQGLCSVGVRRGFEMFLQFHRGTVEFIISRL
jgi:hypothetical protein